LYGHPERVTEKRYAILPASSGLWKRRSDDRGEERNCEGGESSPFLRNLLIQRSRSED
jgi:hypothetical protein